MQKKDRSGERPLGEREGEWGREIGEFFLGGPDGPLEFVELPLVLLVVFGPGGDSGAEAF